MWLPLHWSLVYVLTKTCWWSTLEYLQHYWSSITRSLNWKLKVHCQMVQFHNECCFNLIKNKKIKQIKINSKQVDQWSWLSPLLLQQQLKTEKKTRGNQLRTSTKIHPTSFLRLSHNVFLTTSFSQRFPYIFLVLKTSRYTSNFS